MRDAMKVARKAGRLGPIEFDETTLRIEHSRRFTPLGRRIHSGERPSDIIRKCKSEKMYLDEKKDIEKALEMIKNHFNSKRGRK